MRQFPSTHLHLADLLVVDGQRIPKDCLGILNGVACCQESMRRLHGLQHKQARVNMSA